MECISRQYSEATGKSAHFAKTMEIRECAGHSVLPTDLLFHDSALLCYPGMKFPWPPCLVFPVLCPIGQWDKLPGYRKMGKGETRTPTSLCFATSANLVGFPASIFVFPKVPAFPASFSLHPKMVTSGYDFLQSLNSSLSHSPLFVF